MVLPAIVRTMSPGLLALPSGRFSQAGASATTLSGSASVAHVSIAPMTLAAPHMSNFISSIAAAGLMEMPPESNVTPFPTSTMGAWERGAPRYSRTTSRGGSRLPRATDSSEPMPRRFIRDSSSALNATFECRLARALASSAR